MQNNSSKNPGVATPHQGAAASPTRSAQQMTAQARGVEQAAPTQVHGPKISQNKDDSHSNRPNAQAQLQAQAQQVQFQTQQPQQAQQGTPQQQAQFGPQNAQQAQGQGQAPQQHVKQNPNSTQGTLLFSEMRDSMVIMKDGSFRAVVACKSINFDLMANNEREGVEMSYQDFLNSINFTIQILVRSQRIDIRPYIEKLENLRRDEDNMLLAHLMDDYIDFIDALSQEANIMDKAFFIVIPYYASKDAEKELTETKSFFKSMSRTKGNTVSRINRETYDKAITEINNRCDAVVQGLYGIGIHAVRLNTSELGQLFYNFNNPAEATNQPLGDFNQIAQFYVRKATPEEAEERFASKSSTTQQGQQGEQK